MAQFRLFKKLVGALVLSGLVVWQTPSPGFAAGLEEVRQRGSLRVGMSAAYKPFEYVEGNQIVGYDPDLINVIAEKIGVKAEMIDTNWAGVIASLYSDKFDAIISALTATPERAEKVLFTRPYGAATFYFLTKADRTDLNAAEDFKDLVVAAEAGGASQTSVEKWVQEGKIKFKDSVFLSNPNEAYLAVQVGRADAAVDGLPGLLYFMQNNPGYKVVKGFGPDQVMVMATRKEDADLCKAIDQVIGELQTDGRLVQIQQKWLGQEMETPKALPDYLGVKVCGGE